jgi:hypothetical protein
VRADAVVVPPHGVAWSASAVKEAAEETRYGAGRGNGSRSLSRTTVRACGPVGQQARVWSVIEKLAAGAPDSPGLEAGRGQHACGGSVDAGARVTQRQRPMTWTNMASATLVALSFVSSASATKLRGGCAPAGPAGGSPDPLSRPPFWCLQPTLSREGCGNLRATHTKA